MRLYSIFLFLFIWGFVASGLNALEITTVDAPEFETGLTSAQVTEITEGMGSNPLNALSMFAAVFTFFGMIKDGLLMCLTMLPLIVEPLTPAIGAENAYIIGMFVQGPIWVVEIFGAYQLITGYQIKGAE